MACGLGCLRILTDQSGEDLRAADPCRGEVDDGRRGVHGLGWALIAALVGPVLVVVRDELSQDGQQVPRVVDQHPVQTLPPYSTHPAFGVRVRPRRLRWTTEDLDAFAGEHLVENVGVFGVPVADQEPELPGPLPQVQHQDCGPAEPPTALSGGCFLRGCALCVWRSPSGTTRRYASTRSCRR